MLPTSHGDNPWSLGGKTSDRRLEFLEMLKMIFFIFPMRNPPLGKSVRNNSFLFLGSFGKSKSI
jgi:hypothetical protein